MNTKKSLWATTILTALLITGCNGGDMTTQTTALQSLAEVPAAKWEALSQKNIYFGHQSVGYNILNGIQDIMKTNPQIKLNIVESTDFASQNSGTFFHSAVGKNTDPASKMEAFEKIMTSENAKNIDAAFLKFCYVDILSDANPEKVFNEYNETIARIKQNNSATQIIHFTVPLTTIQGGPKAWVKKILGRKPYGIVENTKRFEYNHVLTTTYAGKEPIFNLALIESTKPDGTKTTFTTDGKAYPALNPQYTTDGGHLNEQGRIIAASQLLLLLVNQIE